MHFTHHLVRRGMELVAGQRQTPEGQGEALKIPGWGVALLCITILVNVGIMFAIKYSYGLIVGVLTMVETPQSVAVVRSDAKESDAPPPYFDDGKTDQELAVIHLKPITSKIRTTILHLRAKAGYWSRFRGLGVWALWNFAQITLVHTLMGLGQRHCFVARAIASIITSVILANMELVWVHTIISEKPQTSWIRQITSFKNWKKIAPAVALKAAAVQAAIVMPRKLAHIFHLPQFFKNPELFGQMTKADARIVFMHAALVVTLSLVLMVGLVVPATVTSVRVAASMLPEEEETIVPFDRTFGGKVVPEVLGGTGKVGLVEAWRSFDRAARVRLLKLVVKLAMMHLAVAVFFGMIYAGEMRLITGGKLRDMVVAYHAQMHGHALGH